MHLHAIIPPISSRFTLKLQSFISAQFSITSISFDMNPIKFTLQFYGFQLSKTLVFDYLNLH